MDIQRRRDGTTVTMRRRVKLEAAP
jgi:hypothetical protein